MHSFELKMGIGWGFGLGPKYMSYTGSNGTCAVEQAVSCI